MQGYSINQRLQYVEERIDRRLFEHEKILQEHSEKIDFFVKTSLPPKEGLIYEGQIFDARVCVDNRLFAFNKMGLDKDLILSAVKSNVKKT